MRARLQTLLGLVMLTATIGLIGWAFVEAVQAQPAVVGSVATAALAVAGVVWQQRKSEKARLREAHRDRMTPIYEELLSIVRRAAENGSSGPSEEMVEFIKDFKSRQLLLGAPSEMITAFNAWEATATKAKEQKDDVSMVLAWEQLLRAIRRDLGHDDSKLPPRELLRVFMSDIDEHLGPQEPTPA